jgi:hypothetical protein
MRRGEEVNEVIKKMTTKRQWLRDEMDNNKGHGKAE